MIARNIAQAPKSKHHSPQLSNLALLEPLAERNDAIDGEFTSAVLVNTAERVIVQAAREKR